MRNIFLALLLANLAFAAWHVWFSDSPRPVRPDDSDLPRITLVKELPTGDADPQVARGRCGGARSDRRLERGTSRDRA